MSGGISNLFWQNTPAADVRVWVAPQILVPRYFRDWLSGKDVAFDRAIRD